MVVELTFPGSDDPSDADARVRVVTESVLVALATSASLLGSVCAISCRGRGRSPVSTKIEHQSPSFGTTARITLPMTSARVPRHGQRFVYSTKKASRSALSVPLLAGVVCHVERTLEYARQRPLFGDVGGASHSAGHVAVFVERDLSRPCTQCTDPSGHTTRCSTLYRDFSRTARAPSRAQQARPRDAATRRTPRTFPESARLEPYKDSNFSSHTVSFVPCPNATSPAHQRRARERGVHARSPPAARSTVEW